MLFQVTIKLTSPLLGDKRDEKNVRRFSRDQSTTLIFDGERWEWMLQNAKSALHLDTIDVGCIFAPRSIALPKVEYYRRRLHTSSGSPFTEQHECVSTGTVMTLDIMVTSQQTEARDNTRPPDRADLRKMLEFSGNFLGISPFGSQKGFGRFTVLQLQEL